MTDNGWTDGKFLVHIHEKWDIQTAAQLDCLNGGADGIWASLCEEGAALGHACSSVTIMNLIRLGNTKVLEKFNFQKLRNVAIAITKHTTGKMPHPKQVLYGERALDMVFGATWGVGKFDIAKFFGFEAPNCISTLASIDMIINRLENLFGKNEQFNEAIATNMKEQMLTDLHHGIKEEYTSPCGIAILFDRAGGKLTEAMADVIAKIKLEEVHHDNLIYEIKKTWSDYDNDESGKERGDDRLRFDSFYHGFMQPYFGCYRCSRTKKAMNAIDMDKEVRGLEGVPCLHQVGFASVSTN